jgi:hypothetical protein
MCSVPLVLATVGTALVSKKISDDAAKKQEKQYKAQLEASNRAAAEANKKFADQMEAEEQNPLLINKTDTADATGIEQLKVKGSTSGYQALGMGANQGVGVNISS